MLPRVPRPGRPTYRCLFRGRASGPLPPNVCHPGPGRHAQALPAVGPVTGVASAGTRDTPAMPPLSHDGLGQGLLRCPLAGKRYTAQSFSPVKGTGTYFRLWGRSEQVAAAADVTEGGRRLPAQTDKGPLVAGVGTYPLGSSRRSTAEGDCLRQPTSRPAITWRYVSTRAVTPRGSAQRTRYDAEPGMATRAFAFTASWSMGALRGTPAPRSSVAKGK